MKLERIQKIIAAAGITSRRKAEELILQGKVILNGKVVTELGTQADPKKDTIKVNGRRIDSAPAPIYIMLNKPKGFVSTLTDPLGRPTVMDLLKRVKSRIYPIGRLDYATEGLLLFTNDGDLANALMHPKYKVKKTYQAKVKGVMSDEQIKQLEEGVYLSFGKTAPCRIKKLRKVQSNSWLQITIHEGKKRQVRLMFSKFRHSVIKLVRIRYASLDLVGLPLGESRRLLPTEIRKLKAIVARPRASKS